MSISLDAVELTPRTANLQPYQSECECAHKTADHTSTNKIIQDYVLMYSIRDVQAFYFEGF